MLVESCTIAQAKAAIRTLPLTCSNCVKQLPIIEWRDQGHRKSCMRDLTQEIKAREQVVYMYEKGLATAKKLQDQVTAQAAKEAGRVQLHINAEAAAKAAKVPAGKKTVTETKHAFTIMQWNVQQMRSTFRRNLLLDFIETINTGRTTAKLPGLDIINI